MKNRFSEFNKSEIQDLMEELKYRFKGTYYIGKMWKELCERYDEFFKGSLRDYINEKSCGAYHHFVFKIGFQQVDVIDTYEFSKYYNQELLDKYQVIEDRQEDNGGDCTNYCCVHYLTIEER